MSTKEDYIKLMHSLCELIIENQGTWCEKEDDLLAKIDKVKSSLSIAEQDELDEIEEESPFAGHPDGWLAHEYATGSKTQLPEIE